MVTLTFPVDNPKDIANLVFSCNVGGLLERKTPKGCTPPRSRGNWPRSLHMKSGSYSLPVAILKIIRDYTCISEPLAFLV